MATVHKLHDDERELPHSADAEQEVLGAILVNNAAYWKVYEYIDANDFAYLEHGVVFDACERLIKTDRVANPITLKAAFENAGVLSNVGGPSYLAKLAAAATSVILAADYARQIAEYAARRAMIALGETMADRAYASDLDDPSSIQIADAERSIHEIMERGGKPDGAATIQDAFRAAITDATADRPRGSLLGVTSGLASLDKATAGLHPGELTILGARPSMGKSTLAIDIARRAAQAGHGVMFFSLEMTSEKTAARMMADMAWSKETPVPYFDYLKGECDVRQQARMAEAARSLNEIPLLIDDRASLDAGQIGAACRRAAKTFRDAGLGLIVVDHLGWVKDSGRWRDQAAKAVGEKAADLKRLAKQMGCPVLCLAQLSRKLEARDDKRPILSDLRDSGEIEEHAETVLFLHRDEYWLAKKGEPKGINESADWRADLLHHANKAEIIIAKQRNGPVTTVHTFCDMACNVFRDLEYRDGM